MQHTIIGKVRSIIYHDSSSLFTVMVLVLYEITEKKIFVTGHMPRFEKDTMLECIGVYQEHPKYGMQFVLSSYQRIIPKEKQALIAYLSSPAFAGIGKKTAEKFVDALGLDCIDKIKNDPNAQYDIDGIKPKQLESIIQTIIKSNHDEQMVSYLTTNGLSLRQMMKVQRVYGEDALWLIKNNPYRLIDDIDGIGFKTADKVALALGFQKDDPLRQEAAIIDHCMQLCMREGDSYIEYNEFLESFHRHFREWDDPLGIFDRVVSKRKLVLEEDRVYPVSQYDSEIWISRYFDIEDHVKTQVIVKDLDHKIALIQDRFNIEYDLQQTRAIKDFFTSPTMIITGGPGTGKTTIVLAIIELCKIADPPVVIETCAPTGRAAKRLTQLSNHKASTIHSLLQWDLETNTFGRDQDNPLSVDVLIVDEFSMVDIYLMAQLVKALPSHTKLLLIGDKDQLPSVAPGNVLNDLIMANACPIVTLKTIYRQQEGSEVIRLAHDVLSGSIDFDFHQDVRFYQTNNTRCKDDVIMLVQKALDKGYQIEDIQVLAPKYSGLAGIDAINHALQKAFNPPDRFKRELQVGYRTYREHDKILQLKNQIDDNVFNGDIGQLVEIIYAREDENRQNRLIVEFDGNFVEYTPDMFINISHAYCMSVHKSQGNEYPIVILLAFKEYGWMLSKRLYYTGITRAANTLICLGEKEAFEKAVRNDHTRQRKTYLKERLVG